MIEGFQKKLNCPKFASATKQPKQQQFQGLWGTCCPGYMGLAATMCAPMCATVRVLPLNDCPNPSQRRQKDFGKSQIFEKLPADDAMPTNGGGGGGLGVTRSSDPRPLPLVRGLLYKKKIVQLLGLNRHKAATIGQKVLTPPPAPQPPKKWHPGTGGGGCRGQNRKIHWGTILSPKMIILQIVRHRISCFGVCYANFWGPISNIRRA